MYVKKEKPEDYLNPRTIRSQNEYVGKVFKCSNSDQQFVIEEFISYKEVKIYFLGTLGTRRTVTMTDIEKGIIDPFTCFTTIRGTDKNCPLCWTEECTPEQKYLGLQYRTNEGYIIEIIGYNGTSDVTVMFLDGSNYQMHTTMQNIKKGQVHNPFKKNQFGGYEGIGPYKTREYETVYRRWYNLLMRANAFYYNTHTRKSKDGKVHYTDAYANLIIDTPFLCYNTFADWFIKEMAQLNPNYEYDIDKDALYPQYKNATGGRKCYGPSTCIIIPHELNTIMSDRENGYYVPKYKIQYTVDKINKIKNVANRLYQDKALTKKSYDAIISYTNYLSSTISN